MNGQVTVRVIHEAYFKLGRRIRRPPWGSHNKKRSKWTSEKFGVLLPKIEMAGACTIGRKIKGYETIGSGSKINCFITIINIICHILEIDRTDVVWFLDFLISVK